ncbi:zinc finger MYND domain-containing protein 12 [Parambassis ranga]|uniref:Zinc finger MYND domain-containing protein 12 n=1 Tax=Parambassis ranga TaxID=210632 RepID=A0A6P7IWF7_9TELE|nr:zinc finger MYND domain-containing protein 12 [Parambassis ranga]
MEVKPNVFGTTSKIYPLSLPKGIKVLCEICQRDAHLQCAQCRVTYYCNAEHQQADWVGIHERICQLLVPIRNPPPLSSQKAIQIETQLKKAELIKICRSVAQSKLSEGKHQEALPAAQCCLRISIDLHGNCNTQLVPAYLLLAEANMGLGNLAQVADLLSLAEWVVSKSPECGYEVHHRLHRSLGRLYTATGNLETALHNFANAIYNASEEYGVDSIITCSDFYLMADVFAKQGEMSIACSLYSEVAHTLHRHLNELFKSHIQNPDKLLDPIYDKAKQVEVEEMLQTILAFQQNDCNKDSAQIALVAHSLAMLWYLAGDSLKALGFGSTALQASQLIPNHDLTESIQGLLQLVQNPQADPHPGSD